MTKIAISPNVNGTGTFTIAAPDSNTDRTLTLPDAGGKVNISGAANEVPAGSATAPSIFPTGDTNTGLFFPASDTTAFATGGSERMRIDSPGHILIGQSVTAIPGLGNTTVGASFEAVAGRALFISRADGPPLFLNANINTQIARFSRSGNSVGNITVSTTATSYATSSDYRLKEDVQPMVNATDRVLSLKPMNFAWKVDGTRVDGFLAHEAQAVVPEAVTGEKDGEEMQAIDQSKLVPLLTAALQEALADIATLKAEVAALKGVPA